MVFLFKYNIFTDMYTMCLWIIPIVSLGANFISNKTIDLVMYCNFYNFSLSIFRLTKALNILMCSTFGFILVQKSYGVAPSKLLVGAWLNIYTLVLTASLQSSYEKFLCFSMLYTFSITHLFLWSLNQLF